MFLSIIRRACLTPDEYALVKENGAGAIGAVLRYLPTPSYFRSWHEA